MSTDPNYPPYKPAGRTYFGFIALIIGIIADLFIGANLAVAYLRIPPSIFSQLNNFTALFYCILTPLAGVLGVAGLVRKKDSKALSWIAIVLVTIPFMIIFIRLVSSFLR